MCRLSRYFYLLCRYFLSGRKFQCTEVRLIFWTSIIIKTEVLKKFYSCVESFTIFIIICNSIVIPNMYNYPLFFKSLSN